MDILCWQKLGGIYTRFCNLLLLGWVSQVLEGLAPSLLQGAEEMQHSICPRCKLKFRIRKNCLRKQLHVEKGAVLAHITNRSI